MGRSKEKTLAIAHAYLTNREWKIINRVFRESQFHFKNENFIIDGKPVTTDEVSALMVKLPSASFDCNVGNVKDKLTA